MQINKIIKKVGLWMLTAVCCVTGCPISVGAAEEISWPQPPNVAAPSAAVMEIGSGAVLYEKNAHKQRYPASITKILTTLLAIENCDLKEEVTFSPDAVYKNEGDTSHISRDVGEKMTLEQCLYGVMLFSANECAYAVAEHVAEKDGGDYAHFIDMMNERAKEIGCTDTNFHNCNGLPDEEHLTSAYDMALISREAYRNETFRKITGTGKYVIPKTNKHKEETPLVNHHNMLYPFTTRKYLYDYCTGGKTGYTQVAQNTLVTFAEKDGLQLVCVVMKEKQPDHYLDTKALLDYGFNNFTAVGIQDKNEENTGTKSMGLLNDNPSYAGADSDSYMVLPKGADPTLAKSEILSQESKGKQIASLRFTYGDHIAGVGGISATGAKVKETIFTEAESLDIKDDDTEKKIVIKPVQIIFIAAIIFVILLVILLIRRVTAGRYARRHSRQMKKMERERFREIKPRRKHRRKDSLFR